MTASTFLFATGIENSYPTINGGRTRIDEMEKCGHYTLWKTDFDLLDEVGIRYLRYGPPIHTTWLGQGRYDWDFCDQTFGDLYRRNVVPIVDLCHFGVPDWIGDFQNPDFPDLFAGYAQAFAERFPWVQLYTPVNEMFVCAAFSAAYGWWNEQLSSDQAFVTALKHIVKANVLAMGVILDVRADAIFIQSESSEHFHPDCPGAIPIAEFYNARRFLPLDLNYSRRVDSDMFVYLLERLLRDQRTPRLGQRPLQRLRRGLRLCRDHPAVPRPLQAAGHAHGDEHQGRPARRRGDQVALERVVQRLEGPQLRRADDRLHVVLAHGSGRLGHRPTGGERHHQPARPV
jgi:hypothetical protein